jgi:polysaccharide deacetylase 2 family uncharacterized protein YibQ
MKSWLVGIFLAILTVVAIVFVGLFLQKSFFTNDVVKDANSSTNVNKTDKNETNISTNIQKLETSILEVKRSRYIIATEIEDYENSKKIVKAKKRTKKVDIKSICKIEKKRKKVYKKRFKDGMPRLAIIMDDIGNISQANHLKEIDFPITPSIFPSTKRHPNTPKIAKSFKHYMVHTPMEAFNFKRVEEDTLKLSDSLDSIDKKIKKIHDDFPKAIAINNHTGSKFTSDAKAMDRLFCALDKYKIRFIDSKTTAHTYGSKMGELHNKVVYSRDTFLDNKPDIDYIIGQIEKAIRVAKKRGLAIAICHPRSETFQALKEAEYLFSDVKLIYVDELY